MAIYFYRTNEPFGEPSNFSLHGFDLDGLHWPMVEQGYQAQKSIGTPHFDMEIFGGSH